MVLTLAEIAPLTRLVVDQKTTLADPAFFSAATGALGAMAAACVAIRWRLLAPEWRRLSATTAATMIVYLNSVAIVDLFQRQVGDGIGIESLQKRAQVALSILWAVLGVAAFVAGVVRLGPKVRIAGLSLLGLATANALGVSAL